MRNIIIISNKIKCNICGDVIESTYTHDYKTCSCGRVAVDGGKEYMKRCFKNKNDYTEMSEWREATYIDKEKEREENRLRELQEREDFFKLVYAILNREKKND